MRRSECGNALARVHYEEQDKLNPEVAYETIPDEIEIDSDCEFEELEVPDEGLDNIQCLNNNMADTAPINSLPRHLKLGSRPGNSRTSRYRRYRQGKDTTGMRSLFEYFKAPNNDNLEPVALPKRSPMEMISESLVRLREPNTESHEKYQLQVLLRYYRTLVKNVINR
ncbi:hypothetical protein V1520DRAFT_329709 [Lipomyces starkeyi]